MNLFSDLMFVSECLMDEARVAAFRNAIQKVITPDSVVLDAGTGTGILALLAAEAGAKKVFAVELVSDLAEVARKNVALNGYSHIIEVVNQDIRTFKTVKPVDVLIMEMMDTGLIQEYQGPAMLSLKRNGVIGTKTILLPDKVMCSAQLINYDFEFYGFNMPFIVQARNEGVRNRIMRNLSEPKKYIEVDLNDFDSDLLKKLLVCRANQAGLINAVELTTQVTLAGTLINHTSDMNMPIIIPVENLEIKVGDEVSMDIQYKMGRGFLDPAFRIACRH